MSFSWCVCVCVYVCVCVRERERDRMLFMGMAAGGMYMMLCNDCFRNVYVYFLCGFVCTCMHQSDAELTFMCFS